MAMAREVIRWGGWSGLRKAELLERISAELSDRDNLERVASDLSDTEREALRQVLASGRMHWTGRNYPTRYGDDLPRKSPYLAVSYAGVGDGTLALRGLLAEATVDKRLLVVIPLELRQALSETLD